MAKTVLTAVAGFRADTVDLDSSETARARASRDYLLKQLRTLESSVKDFPKLKGSFVPFGSFARSTKIRPLDDVDVLCLVDGTGTSLVATNIKNTYRLVATPGAPLDKFLGPGQEVNSTRVLNKIRDSLGTITNYRKADVRKTMQAVTLDLSSYPWVFDIVPAVALYRTSDGSLSCYLIPDGKGQWIKTAPQIDAANVTRVNKHHAGQFLPLLRLLKYWNNRPTKPRLASYHFETLAINVFDGAPQFVSLGEGIKYFFGKCQTSVLLSCPDPKGLGPDLDASFDMATNRCGWDSRSVCTVCRGTGHLFGPNSWTSTVTPETD